MGRLMCRASICSTSAHMQGNMQRNNMYSQHLLFCLRSDMLFSIELSKARESLGCLKKKCLPLGCGAARLRERPIARDADVGQPLLHHQAAGGALHDVHKVDVAIAHLAHLRTVNLCSHRCPTILVAPHSLFTKLMFPLPI